MVQKRFRRLFLVVVLFLAGLSNTQSSLGQTAIPEPVILMVPSVTQQTSVWCWLAVAEMVIRYRHLGNSPTQCRMMEIGYNVPNGTCCGREQACARTANGMNELMAVIQSFGGLAVQWSPPADPMALYATLRQDKPVIAQIQSGPTSTHVIVIRGMRFQTVTVGFYPNGMPNVQVIPIVLVNDPMSILPSEVSYAKLTSVWIDAVVVGASIAAPLPPPHTSSVSPMCNALNQAIAAAPSLDALKGEKEPRDDEDVADIYQGTLSVPNMHDCEVWVRDDQTRRPYYRCKVLTADESDCADVEARTREIAHRIRSCLPSWTFTNLDKRRTYDFKVHGAADEDDDSLELFISVSESANRCSAAFSFE